MKRLLIFSLSLLVVIVVSLSTDTQRVEAGVIYDNGGPDLQNGIFSDFAAIPPQQVGDDFVLSPGANVITDIHWWGGYDTSVPANDVFSIRLFNITSGSPDTNPSYSTIIGGVTHFDTGNKILAGSLSGFEVFEYAVDVAPISLIAGTPYLLSIVNGSGIADTWFWATTSLPDISSASVRSSDGNAWTTILPEAEMAFNFTSTPIPEPSTLLLFGVGLVGVGLLRRRFKK